MPSVLPLFNFLLKVFQSRSTAVATMAYRNQGRVCNCTVWGHPATARARSQHGNLYKRSLQSMQHIWGDSGAQMPGVTLA